MEAVFPPDFSRIGNRRYSTHSSNQKHKEPDSIRQDHRGIIIICGRKTTAKSNVKHRKSPEARKYLGHTKSSGSDTFLFYNRLQKIFFLYSLIEKRTLYLSMLFDHTSNNIMIPNYFQNLFWHHMCWLHQNDLFTV
jgi:hypothetical protein